jgi:acyl-CoA synthetase (AMP-forming)/AMP-acid ligase II
VVVDDGSDAVVPDGHGVDYEIALAGSSPARDFGERSGDDTYLLYTGGTTGMPKGVLWRHEDVWHARGGGIDYVTGERAPDEWHQSRAGEGFAVTRLCLPPLIHGAAQWSVLPALFGCGTVVIMPRFAPDEVWRVIERRRVNVVTLVGDAMGRPLIEAFAEGSYDASSLVAISSHAALFSPSVRERFLAALVQPRPGSSPDLSELDAHVRGLLAGYKAPRSVWLVDQIGRSPSGKPDYRWAQRHAAAHQPMSNA